MSFYDAIRVGAAGAADTFQIERSVRISRDSGNYFSVNNSSSGNKQTFTFSFWMKLGKLYNNFLPIYSHYLTGNNRCGIVHTGTSASSAGFQYQNRQSSSWKALIDPAEKLRDHSAWYHVVFRMDTTNSTQNNRFIIYVNGREIAQDRYTGVAQNSTSVLNSATTHYIGHDGYYGTGDFYLADIHLIDGQALDASYFAETDAITGQWMPKEYTGSYSGTSYHLKFDDNSGTTATTLGKDSSGLGNNVTPVNFSVSSGLGNDSFEDTPTNNFPTLNPNHAFLNGSSSTTENGNLQWNGQSNNQAGCPASMAFPTTGKWYWEVKLLSSNSNFSFGITPATYSNVINPAVPTGSIGYAAYGSKIISGSETANAFASFSNSDNIGAALDMDNNEIKFYKNNSLVGTISLVSGYESVNYLAWIKGDTASQLIQGAINFGGNGFVYTPPTGFKALNSANLPDPTILLPDNHFNTLLYTGNASTNNITGLNFKPDWLWIKSRVQAYNHYLWDTVRGSGSKALASSNTNAEPTDGTSLVSFNSDGFSFSGNSGVNDTSSGTNGFVAWNWNAGDTDSATYIVKVVSDGGNKYRFNNFGTSAVTLDLAEGGTYTFDQSDSSMSSHPMQLSTTANGTHGGGSAYSTGVTYQLDGSTVTASAFISGFSSASSRKLIITVAASAPTLYYYCYYHSGMGGAVNTNSTLGSSNFDGAIQSTVKANTTAGFSIVGYTGINGAGTIGHGLGVAPRAVIIRRRDSASDWAVFHAEVGNTKRLVLNSIAAESSANSSFFNNTSPTSTTISLGSDAGTGGSTDKYIVYAFSEVAGYSKFGKYTGNGSSDGTFVFTGFRPAWVLIKTSSKTDSWLLMDNKRSTSNVVTQTQAPQSSLADNLNTGGIPTDFLSNGFKCRGSGGDFNQSGATMIYFAFAESPFKNARAR